MSEVIRGINLMESNHYILANLILGDFNLILVLNENTHGFEMFHKVISARPRYWHHYICIVGHR